MNLRKWLPCGLLLLLSVVSAPLWAVQPPGGEKPEPKKKFKFEFPGGPGGQRRELVKQFDKDGNGWLDNEERKAARAFIKKQGGPGGFGGFGKGKKGPGGFGGFGAFLTKPLLEALDTDKDGKLTQAEFVAGVKQFFADSDKEKKGHLTEEQIAEGIDRIFPRPKGFPDKGPGGPAFRFGPSKGIAANIVKRADPGMTGKVTLDALVKAAEALFQEVDKGKAGKLDEPQVTAGVNLMVPQPKFKGPGGFGKSRPPAKPGPKVTPAEVKAYPNAGLYEPTVLRTLFLEFENTDWEEELSDFRNTDVEVPATLTVDGKKYPNVGVHFRGMSSLMMTPAGYRRSLNVSLDFLDRKQRLYGHKTLNLLNSADDPSFLHTVLYSHIARRFIPAPKANLVKVVINGESWGVYVNAEQFNKDFLRDNYQTTKGARWKVRGNPGAAAGLDYLGEDVEAYKRKYTIKSKDNPKDWKALIELCRTLSKTPTDKLVEALRPILDIDGVLWFLALDNALINNDGYWVRASDYSIYRDPKGKFHIIPHDMNETFQPAMMFGFGKGGPKGGFGKGPKDGKGEKGPKGGFGGPRGGGYNLDPLVGMDDVRKPLRSRLLAVPELRKRYLENVRHIAEVWLDWKKLGPIVAQYRALIAKEVEQDTRKLYSLAEFRTAVSDEPALGSRNSLRAFADQRRQYLLNYPAIRELGARR